MNSAAGFSIAVIAGVSAALHFLASIDMNAGGIRHWGQLIAAITFAIIALLVAAQAVEDGNS